MSIAWICFLFVIHIEWKLCRGIIQKWLEVMYHGSNLKKLLKMFTYAFWINKKQGFMPKCHWQKLHHNNKYFVQYTSYITQQYVFDNRLLVTQKWIALVLLLTLVYALTNTFSTTYIWFIYYKFKVWAFQQCQWQNINMQIQINTDYIITHVHYPFECTLTLKKEQWWNKTQPVSTSFHKKIQYNVPLRDWNVLKFKDMPSLFSFIILLRFIAPLHFTNSLSGERRAWTSQRFLWFVTWSFSNTFYRTAGMLLSRDWKVPLREFTGCHQRLSDVHILALSLAQLAARVSIVEVHFDDQRFLWEVVGWEKLKNIYIWKQQNIWWVEHHYTYFKLLKGTKSESTIWVIRGSK